MSKSLVCEGQVVRFAVDREGETTTLALSARSPDPERVYELRFSNVIDLRFENPVNFDTNIVLLAERFTSEGWEGIEFRVSDHEHNFVSFYCGTIEYLR